MQIALRWMIAAAAILVGIGAMAAEGGPTCLEHLGPIVTLDEIDGGRLLYRTGVPGRYVEAPTQSTSAHVTVHGLVARANVAQTFGNPSDQWVEGVYVFPLPENAAVDRMRLVVGERIIEGQVREKQQARKEYRKAKREGKTASLVEQERPNIFTTSVANIGPGETIRVEIEYQQVLRYADGTFELRFPTVVGPRYLPGAPTSGSAVEEGWGIATTTVPDGGRITPPVMPPGSPDVNPVALEISLDAGVPLDWLVCPSHPVAISWAGATEVVVSLETEIAPADRDFVLRWRPERGREPRAALFTEELDGETYALMMVLPPAAEHVEQVRLSREVVLVIDTSGSMHGASIIQARRALEIALDRLDEEDYFNIIRFSSGTSRLFEESRQALPSAVEDARRWVGRLDADGGTEMLSAVHAALEDRLDLTPVRQVVFVTDGCVGNEEQLFRAIEQKLGRSRLFTVGIGSAPNSHFMRRAAEFGRGTFTHISRPEDVAELMGSLLTKLEDPVLSGIDIRWPDPLAEQWPPRVPDLYTGEPVIVTARLGSLAGEALISGRLGLQGWQTSLPMTVRENRGGVHQLWARKKIASLMDRITTSRGSDDGVDVRSEILDVALRHHLVSKFTSLVAVDVTPRRPVTASLRKLAVPTNLPHGWSHAHVTGQLPRGGTAGPASLTFGLLLLVAAAVVWRWSRR